MRKRPKWNWSDNKRQQKHQAKELQKRQGKQLHKRPGKQLHKRPAKQLQDSHSLANSQPQGKSITPVLVTDMDFHSVLWFPPKTVHIRLVTRHHKRKVESVFSVWPMVRNLRLWHFYFLVQKMKVLAVNKGM